MTTATAGLTFEPDAHAYWYGMAQVPSVSEIMRPLTEQYLKAIPEDILNWKRDLGIAVHKACELFDLGELDEDSLDPQIIPYLEGYKRFLVDYRPLWTEVEAIVFNEADWYAGTLDRRGFLTGLSAIVDLKTSAEISSYAGIQLWAYALAAGAPDSSLYALQLLKTGDYRLHPFTDVARYANTWRSLLTLHEWRKENRK